MQERLVEKIITSLITMAVLLINLPWIAVLANLMFYFTNMGFILDIILLCSATSVLLGLSAMTIKAII